MIQNATPLTVQGDGSSVFSFDCSGVGHFAYDLSTQGDGSVQITKTLPYGWSGSATIASDQESFTSTNTLRNFEMAMSGTNTASGTWSANEPENGVSETAVSMTGTDLATEYAADPALFVLLFIFPWDLR
jgi:hypothetical protein